MLSTQQPATVPSSRDFVRVFLPIGDSLFLPPLTKRGPRKGDSRFLPVLAHAGSRLELNYRTSGGGGLQVELQDETGAPVKGLGMKDCPRIIGDRTGKIVRWDPAADLSHWAGRPVRLRMRLRDAHLYAFRFH